MRKALDERPAHRNTQELGNGRGELRICGSAEDLDFPHLAKAIRV
jgi:hypothetical protein